MGKARNEQGNGHKAMCKAVGGIVQKPPSGQPGRPMGGSTMKVKPRVKGCVGGSTGKC